MFSTHTKITSQEVVKCNDSEITFELVRSKRRSISIAVYPSAKVRVSAPLRTSIKYIKNMVQVRADWIVAKQKHFANHPKQKAQTYEEGSNIKLLGSEYCLKIIPDIRNAVILDGENINVHLLKPSKAKVKAIIKNWYEQQAREVFTERLKPMQKLAEAAEIKFNGNLKFRWAKRRWGSCSRKGEINLNYELVKMPLDCIDYVILHELCHIREFNHSKRFYGLMSSLMPDWKVRKATLSRLAEVDYGE